MNRNHSLFLRCGMTAAAALLVVGAIGCGKSSRPPPPDSDTPVVALIMKSLANEFFLTMETGAKEHHQEHAGEYELRTQGIKNESDVSRQVQLVEQMIASGVDAIVIAPADSKALVGVCKQAMDQGIVVVNIDNKLDDAVLAGKDIAVPFVGPDNRKGARMVAECLSSRLEPGDPVIIIEGVPSAFNAIQRKLGFEDAIQAAGLTLVASQSGEWEMAKANAVVSALVTEHPDLKAVLCANDSMALGAVAALKNAGRMDDVVVVGFDNISAVRDLIEDGTVLATADQHADRLAVFGIEYALEMIRENTVPEDRETPVDLITKK